MACTRPMLRRAAASVAAGRTLSRTLLGIYFENHAGSICWKTKSTEARWNSSPAAKYRDDDNDDDETNKRSMIRPNPPTGSPLTGNYFADASLRGVGQVIFLDSPYAGIALLGGLAVGNPYLSTMAAAGAATSTAVAWVANLDSPSLSRGLWGYNGCLVGCAAASFASPLPAADADAVVGAASSALTWTVFGAAASPFVSAVLKPAMGAVPQWTLAFNLVALSALLRTKPLAAASTPIDAEAAVAGASEAVTVTPSISPSLSDLYWLAEVPLKGVSQIFIVDSALSGAALICGTAALYSPGLAMHAVVGSTVGAATGYWALGAPFEEVCAGLWGYNSALTSMGVGTFFAHSNKTVALSVGGAAATAVVFGAMKVVFGAMDAPCLTLPFCATMSGCYLLGIGRAIPGLLLAKEPHSPEKNE